MNPAENVWQWIKDRTAMKTYTTSEDLEYKIEELLHQPENQIIKSITGYDFYINAHDNVFKV